MYPWRRWIGTIILSAAFLVHYRQRVVVDLHSPLAAAHPLGMDASLARPLYSRAADVSRRGDAHCRSTSRRHDLLQHRLHRPMADYRPWLGAVQMLAVVTVWIHACIGIHYWLRVQSRWYPTWRPLLFTYALLLPTLALAGYVTGGNQVAARSQAIPISSVRRWRTPISPTKRRRRSTGWPISAGGLSHRAAALAVRRSRHLRNWYYRPPTPPILAHANGRSMPIWPGATVLGNAARERHRARVGLRRPGALHHLPDHGDQRAR